MLGGDRKKIERKNKEHIGIELKLGANADCFINSSETPYSIHLCNKHVLNISGAQGLKR